MTGPICPCLWFDGQARAAVDLYARAFGGARIVAEHPVVVTFLLGSQPFMALDGGPMFRPNPSISFFAREASADAVERAWSQLSDGGRVLMPLDAYPWSETYGWVEDRFGVSWQVMVEKPEQEGQRFSPLLMFTGDVAGRAEEAIGFYTSVFPGSSLLGLARYAPGEGDKDTYVKHARFTLGERLFMAMDSSAPHGFGFTEGVSLVVRCDTQEEIDTYWQALTADGGSESMCGWLKDKYGVSWQVVPSILNELMTDPERGPRVVEAFRTMRKFDIGALQRA